MIQQTYIDPKLTDKALLPIRQKLENNLLWLRSAFGVCEVHTDNDKKKRPIIYQNGIDSIDLFPNDRYGNFSFFHRRDGDEFEQINTRTLKINSPLSLIMWGRFKDVSTDNELISVENVKHEVLQVLKSIRNKSLKIELQKIYSNPAKVYNSFTTSEIDGSQTMRPFFCLRFDLDLKFYDTDFC